MPDNDAAFLALAAVLRGLKYGGVIDTPTLNAIANALTSQVEILEAISWPVEAARLKRFTETVHTIKVEDVDAPPLT